MEELIVRITVHVLFPFNAEWCSCVINIKWKYIIKKIMQNRIVKFYLRFGLTQTSTKISQIG